MALLPLFHQFLHEHPQARHQPWLVAVSGGLDSVVLAHLCRSAGVAFAMAHCNFNLRGAESLRDRDFVAALAGQWQVPFFIKEFDTAAYLAETGKNVQAAARELRYAWFREIAAQKKYRLIATAHHADDNAETVLMHLFRGSGIRGLRGMLPVQEDLIRPLLHAGRPLLEQYAQAQGLQWVEDSSNQTDHYTRNQLRHHLFPLIRQAIPQGYQGFERSIGLLAETEVLYKAAIEQQIRKLVESRGNEVHIPVLKLVSQPAARTLLYEMLQPYGFAAAQLEDAYGLLQAPSGKYVASATHRLLRNRAWLIIAPLQTTAATHILIEKGETDVVFEQGCLHLQKAALPENVVTEDACTVLLDAADIHFPLMLRPWKQGDYFYPLGMQKKKKLSRFFIDRKLSKTEKERIWVVESRKKILWVIGQRIDNRFRLRPGTRQVLQLRFEAV